MQPVEQEQVGDQLIRRQRLGEPAVVVVGDVCDQPRETARPSTAPRIASILPTRSRASASSTPLA